MGDVTGGYTWSALGYAFFGALGQYVGDSLVRHFGENMGEVTGEFACSGNGSCLLF